MMLLTRMPTAIAAATLRVPRQVYLRHRNIPRHVVALSKHQLLQPLLPNDIIPDIFNPRRYIPRTCWCALLRTTRLFTTTVVMQMPTNACNNGILPPTWNTFVTPPLPPHGASIKLHRHDDDDDTNMAVLPSANGYTPCNMPIDKVGEPPLLPTWNVLMIAIMMKKKNLHLPVTMMTTITQTLTTYPKAIILMMMMMTTTTTWRPA